MRKRINILIIMNL